MNGTLRPRLASLAAIPLIALAGCGANNGLNLARVSGTVSYDGQPIKKGTVFFMPDESKGTVGPPAVGSINADGSFVMSTEFAGDGTIVGTHRVGITGVEENPIEGGEEIDPEKDGGGYMKAKAKAAATVRSSRKKLEEFYQDKAGKQHRYVIPRKFSSPEESGIVAKVESGSNSFRFEIDGAGNVRINR